MTSLHQCARCAGALSEDSPDGVCVPCRLANGIQTGASVRTITHEPQAPSPGAEPSPVLEHAAISILAGVGLVAALALLAVSVWRLEDPIFLVLLPVIARLTRRVPWGRVDRLLCGILLALGALGLVVYAFPKVEPHWSGGYWLLVAGWFYYEVSHLFQRDEGTDGSEEEASDLPLPDDERALLKVLREFDGEEGVYLYPELPPDALARARESSEVPADEQILCLVDLTGDEEDAADNLLFGGRAAYGRVYRKDADAAVTIPYTDFAARRFIDHGRAVYLGKDRLLCPDPERTDVTCEQLTRMLNAVKQHLAEAAESDRADAV